MQTVLCSVVNFSYIPGLEVMIKTLVDNNPRVLSDNIPFYVITDNTVTEQDLVYCKYVYPNLKHITKSYDRYRALINKFIPLEDIQDKHKVSKTMCGFLKFEIFSMKTDRLVFIDADCMVKGDISYLLDFQHPFGAVAEMNLAAASPKEEYNTGVLVLNSEYLNNEFLTFELICYSTLLPFICKSDQLPINDFFENKITDLPVEYNYLKSYLGHMSLSPRYHLSKHCKILHYVYYKPWEQIKLEERVQSEFKYDYSHIWWCYEYLQVYKKKIEIDNNFSMANIIYPWCEFEEKNNLLKTYRGSI